MAIDQQFDFVANGLPGRSKPRDPFVRAALDPTAIHPPPMHLVKGRALDGAKAGVNRPPRCIGKPLWAAVAGAAVEIGVQAHRIAPLAAPAGAKPAPPSALPAKSHSAWSIALRAVAPTRPASPEKIAAPRAICSHNTSTSVGSAPTNRGPNCSSAAATKPSLPLWLASPSPLSPASVWICAKSQLPRCDAATECSSKRVIFTRSLQRKTAPSENIKKRPPSRYARRGSRGSTESLCF